MITKQLLKVFNSFSSKSEPFLQFLASKAASIEVKKGSMRTALGMDIAVSRTPVSRAEATEFMKKKGITKKKVLVNVDSSHVIGMRRSLAKNYMEVNVYKGHGESPDILSKDNPNYLLADQQIIFNPSVFMRTDPVFLERVAQQKEDDAIQDEVILLYNKDPERGGKRLHEQYSIPPEYVPIIQAAHNLDNTIYFVGLNQYEIRLLFSAYLPLNQMKMFFMECLKYVHSLQEPQDLKTKYFKYRCKEFMWKEYYSFWQPINYQQLITFKRNIKGFCFAHSYNFLRPDHPMVNMDEAVKDKEADAAKIEKHAILSVLFGDIWGQHYTRNPYMYLSSDYSKMSEEDKETVKQLYRSFYGKYWAAKKKFFQISASKE